MDTTRVSPSVTGFLPAGAGYDAGGHCDLGGDDRRRTRTRVAALAAINSEHLLQHIRVLSSERLRRPIAGRRTGRRLTLAYLVREFKRLGLEPADQAGTTSRLSR